jgi:hypothetical protein
MHRFIEPEMGDSSQSTRRAPNLGLEATNEVIYNATQIIEAFVNRVYLSMRVVDAWKRVKNAATQGFKGDNSRRISDTSYDYI